MLACINNMVEIRCGIESDEGGYKRVKDLLWKTLSLHTDVHEEWIRIIRDQCRGFKNNSADFAANLLEGKKKCHFAYAYEEHVFGFFQCHYSALVLNNPPFRTLFSYSFSENEKPSGVYNVIL